MALNRKAKEILEHQSREISRLAGTLGKNFDKALDLVRSGKGAIVLVGFGKSGAVCAKLAATFRSAGRLAYVLDPVEAFHGEAAAIGPDDVAIAVSSSGESDEIMRITPWIRKRKAALIALTSSERSSLARAADIVLPTAPPADPTDAAASYTTCVSALAIGDLIGMSLLYEKAIDSERAEGTVAATGEAIFTIEDMLSARKKNPVVGKDVIFKDALIELTTQGLGAISVTDDDGRLAGIVTDGDVRRLLQKSQGSLTSLFLTSVGNVMTRNPKRITSTKSLHETLKVMEDNAITVLPVVNEKSKPVGMVHLHDLVQLGILQKSAPESGSPKKEKTKTKATKRKTRK